MVAFMQNTKVLIAHLGARKHYQEPLLFHQWGILDRFYTDFYFHNSAISQILRQPNIYKHLPTIIKKSLERYEPSLIRAKVSHFPWFGYQYVRALKRTARTEHTSLFVWAGREFCRQILERGIADNITTIYGYNSASLELFTYAKSKGINCVLDQTLAEWSLVHKLLLEEEELWSQWSLYPFQVRTGDKKLLEREQQEQDLADRIICGSNFVKDSLSVRDVEKNKIAVVPFGRSMPSQNKQGFRDRHLLKQKKEQELRILFAGAVCLRKGIPYLLKALELLSGKIPFTCKIAGSIQIQPERVAEYSHLCDFLGLVTRSEMASLYTWADVFVLPSVCEGSAMVVYEALSWGLPVITTYNSGSIIRDGIDGSIVPIRNPQAIADGLVTIFEQEQFGKTLDSSTYIQSVYHNSQQILFDALTN